MKRPSIEKELKKKGNIVAGSGALLCLGVGALSAATTTPLITIMILGVMTPIMSDIVGVKLLTSKFDWFVHEIAFLNKPVKKLMSKWINKHIENSENLTEKKYKVVCLALWMKHNGLSVNRIFPTGSFIDLSQELFDKKETKNHSDLSNLFYQIEGLTPNIKTFLEEDKNHPQKIEIAKKVYKEYSEVGMAARAFLKRENYDEVLTFQDYKFTPHDYSLIKKYIKEEIHLSTFIVSKLYSDESIELMKKLINAETEPNNLKILKEYCTAICEYYKDAKDTKFKELPTLIDYVELSRQLELKGNNQNLANRKKIKI